MPEFHKRLLPDSRKGQTFKFRVEDIEGYVTCGEFSDGALAEIFLTISKHGSTLGGWADAFAIMFSGMLQFAPDPREALKWLVVKMTGLRFEPHGMTDDPTMRYATSVVDYIVRQLAELYLTDEERAEVAVALKGPVASL